MADNWPYEEPETRCPFCEEEERELVNAISQMIELGAIQNPLMNIGTQEVKPKKKIGKNMAFIMKRKIITLQKLACKKPKGGHNLPKRTSWPKNQPK